MILDTTFIAALRYDPDARALAREHEAANLPQRIPVMTLTELYVSVGQGTQPHDNARKHEELIANLDVVPTTQNIGRRAGVLAGLHESSDTKPSLGIADATIAATGLVYNEPVVTDDLDDFESVDGLAVTTW